MSDDTVRVSVRIRPLVPGEIEKGCQSCLSVVPGEQQIQIRNGEKAFTFNHVFGPTDDHEYFYNTAVKEIVTKLFKGYNVTILAYGQTGSGKTYSMGTNYNENEPMGVIPRAVNDIFDTMEAEEEYVYRVTVSFMELYNEQLYDLLADKRRSDRVVDIREDTKSIKIVGLTEKVVTSASGAISYLIQGSQERATGATAMNASSSRSHAIFTIVIHQSMRNDPNSATTSKFHLVDLAGSERSKKTQATGERFKEGVNINKGLLALGNVISQLGEGGSSTYIGYRDSKLTRLLQDSLGGNSMTLMIACVSPADYNLDESLSTLRYADRARKIKNKPIVNQDPKSAEINRLNNLVQELRLVIAGQGPTESPFPSAKLEQLLEENDVLQKKLRDITNKFNANLVETVYMHERAHLYEQAQESNTLTIKKIIEEFAEALKEIPDSLPQRQLLESIYSKLDAFQREQEKTATEVLHHELTAMSSMDKSSDDIQDEELKEISGDPDLRASEHNLRQEARNKEVQDINRELALKEELVSTLLRNSLIPIELSNEVQSMETEIKKLQTEKEELMQALQNVQNNSVTAKLSQTRRKKVQELEKKISELSRTCMEQKRLIKKKEKSDEQIKNLGSEIQSLKQTKVKLVREMRKESETFSKWKRACEREMHRLRDQDKKTQNAMTRLQLQHNKQQNVFKRKMEEAFAVNKRLKEAMELQRKAQLRREKNASANEDGIREWVQQECAVLVSTIDVEITLEKLLQYRTDLAKELEALKSTSNADSPRTKKKITELNGYLDLRNAQIADLQRELIESDQEIRGNTRINSIHSMSDAKAALKVLFDAVAIEHKRSEIRYAELMDKYDQALLGARQTEIRQNTSDKATLVEMVETLQEKCRKLENEASSQPAPKKQKALQAPAEKGVLHDSTFDLSDDSLSEDDKNDDPDWKKTPLYNRIRKTMSRKSEFFASKRSSDGEIKCACKSTCSTRVCSCRKNNVVCTNCNCNPLSCVNRDQENQNKKELFFHPEETQDTDNNHEAFKRPRFDAEG